MQIFKIIKSRLSIVADLFRFLWQNKLWWLLPVVVVLLVVGALVLFAQGTTVAPFVYTIF